MRHTREITIDQAGEVHDGGCLCGAVRYQTVGVPRWQAACHCRFCQRLTGSVLNAEVVFPKDHVLFSGDKPKVYAYRSPDHGRMRNVQFCPECSVTVGLTFERFPLVQAILSGTYDDPRWIQMDKHIFSAYAMPWMAYSEATDVYSEHHRPIAIGRNTWLFAGSLRAGKRAAAVMSLVHSERLNGHDPYAYLKDLLERLPTQPASRVDELLPHRWSPAS